MFYTNVDNEGTATTKSSGAHLQLPSRVPGSESFVAGHRVKYAVPPISDPCDKR